MNFKVLCIIPYDGLKEKIEKAQKKLALDYPKITLNFTYLKANLSSKKSLIEELKRRDFDIIISRGGTISLIKNNTNRVVIDIGISQYDIVRTLKMVSNLDKTAFVCYSNFKNVIQNTIKQLNINLKNVTVSNKREILKVLDKLAIQGYKNIICDSGILLKSPTYYPFNFYLIESGDEVVEQAIKNCYILLNERSRNLNYHRIFDDAINYLADYTLVFNNKYLEKPLFVSLSCKRDNIYPKIKDFWYQNNKVFKIKNKYYQINIIKSSEMTYCLIRYLYIKKDVDNTEIGFKNAPLFYNIQYSNDFMNMLRVYAKNDGILCIVGEHGLYKPYICSLIAKQRDIDTIFINTFHFSNENEILKEINNPNSHLYDSNHILVFHNLSSLTINAQHILYNFIQTSSLYRRNKVIFTQDQSANVDLKISLSRDLLIKEIFLKPLRNLSRSDFKELVTTFINRYTMSTGKTITGIDEMALDRISSYDWPGNYKEFYDVINTILKITTGPLIKERELETVLTQSSQAYQTLPETKEKTSSGIVHQGKSLHDMIAEDIKWVLNKNNGNKSKTADELEISRSTIWRYLK